MLELRERGYTQERIAKIADKSQADVWAYMRIPELPDEIRDAFFRGEISLEHVKVLLRLDDTTRERLSERILEEGLSVEDSRAVARLMTGELEVPDFFDKEEFGSLLGRGIRFRSTRRGATLRVTADNVEELEEILKSILKIEKD